MYWAIVSVIMIAVAFAAFVIGVAVGMDAGKEGQENDRDPDHHRNRGGPDR